MAFMQMCNYPRISLSNEAVRTQKRRSQCASVRSAYKRIICLCVTTFNGAHRTRYRPTATPLRLSFAYDGMNVRPVSTTPPTPSSTSHRCVVISDVNACCSLLHVCCQLISIYYSADRHTTTIAAIRCVVATSTVGNQQVAVRRLATWRHCASTNTTTQ